jgi:ABC-2 type transport system permease protein
MNFERIFVIIGKEWAQTFNKWSAWNAIILVPAVITALLMFVLYQLNKIQLPVWVMDYFLMLFVAMPSVNAARIAASGIMADKASRSLEPLLATPLTPGELIIGKVVVAVVPPTVVAWIFFGIFILRTRQWGILQSELFGQTSGLVCLAAVLSCTLLATVLVTLIGFSIAAGKTEARSAALSSTGAAEMIMILPLVGVFYGQTHHLAGTTWTLAAAGGLMLADLVLFLLAVKLFERESVLFKWK